MLQSDTTWELMSLEAALNAWMLLGTQQLCSSDGHTDGGWQVIWSNPSVTAFIVKSVLAQSRCEAKTVGLGAQRPALLFPS